MRWKTGLCNTLLAANSVRMLDCRIVFFFNEANFCSRFMSHVARFSIELLKYRIQWEKTKQSVILNRFLIKKTEPCSRQQHIIQIHLNL